MAMTAIAHQIPSLNKPPPLTISLEKPSSGSGDMIVMAVSRLTFNEKVNNGFVRALFVK